MLQLNLMTHPVPQGALSMRLGRCTRLLARTVADVSEAAARFPYGHADDLHRWLNRYDFMVAQKGLRFHLGDQKYSEFEARFLEKTARYPRGQKANKSLHSAPR